MNELVYLHLMPKIIVYPKSFFLPGSGKEITLVLFLLCTLSGFGQTTKTSFAPPRFFEYAFKTDSSILGNERKWYSFRTETLGKINISSGKLVVSFFEHSTSTKPYIQTFPLGDFPVEVSYLDEEGTSGIIAYARITFSSEPVTRWEYAIREGESKRILGDSSFVAFYNSEEPKLPLLLLSDSAIAMNFNKNSEGVINSKMQEETYWDTAQIKAFALPGNNEKIYSFFTSLESTQYVAFTGFDKNGRVCRFLLDLGNFVLPSSEYRAPK